MIEKQLVDCGPSVATAYESQADRNAFTDAEKTKLATVGEGAAVVSVNGLDGEVVIDIPAVAIAGGAAGTAAINAFTKQQYNTITTLVGSGAPPVFSLDMDIQPNPFILLTADSTLANPTNVKAGATGSVLVKQDATGGRTLALGAMFIPLGGIPLVFDAGANKYTILVWKANEDATQLLTSITKGF